MSDFRNIDKALMVKGDSFIRAEFEKDGETYPSHMDTLYIDGNWYTPEQARELRDFLNEVLPE